MTKQPGSPLLLAGDILTPQGILHDHVLEIFSGRIARIIPVRQLHHKSPVTRLSKGVLVPGFIDLQVNGVGDCDLAVHGDAAVGRLAKHLARNGCTGFLAALITSDRESLRRGIASASPWIAKPNGGARLLGVHLEGPFLNVLKRGIHPTRHVEIPSRKNVDDVLKIGGSSLRLMTLAPEMPGGMELVKRLKKENVVASIGHSNASYDEAMRAFEAGIKSVTHLFNACSPFHHRAPGIVGAALQAPEVLVQIISDGIHVHPAALDSAYRIKGKNKTVLVTDALVGGGKQFRFAGKKICSRSVRPSIGRDNVILRSGSDEGSRMAIKILRVAQDDITVPGQFIDAKGVLAGSSLGMAVALTNFRSFVRAPLEDLIQCVSSTPATLLGLGRSKGTLENGKDADMVWLDDKGGVLATWVGGEQVYVRDNRIHR